ncbi:MAG: hypothetical protein KDD60_01820 [Bdellovibrionales bacterium]|nr:hypothetical protein [Bdellovibrionales bacterium]
MEPEVTPFDILTPPPPPFEVGLFHWGMLFLLFLVFWGVLLMVAKAVRSRRRVQQRISVPPIVEELQSQASRFRKKPTKDSLSLFVLTLRRVQEEYPDRFGELLPHVQRLEAARYAETLELDIAETITKVLQSLTSEVFHVVQ